MGHTKVPRTDVPTYGVVLRDIPRSHSFKKVLFDDFQSALLSSLFFSTKSCLNKIVFYAYRKVTLDDVFFKKIRNLVGYI